MLNEIDTKIKILVKKREKEIRKCDDLIKSSSRNNKEELREILTKCHDISDEIGSLLQNRVSGLARDETKLSKLMDANYQLLMDTNEAQRKLAEIMLGKLEGSSMENELRSFFVKNRFTMRPWPFVVHVFGLNRKKRCWNTERGTLRNWTRKGD